MIEKIKAIIAWIIQHCAKKTKVPKKEVPKSSSEIYEWKKSKLIEVTTLKWEKPTFPVKYLIVHHSATKDTYLKNTKAIRRYHKKVRHFKDIGYHWLVERYKKDDNFIVVKGRSMEEKGAHAQDGGFNHNSLGICLIGNLDTNFIPLYQYYLGLLLVKRLQILFEVQKKNIIGHREAQALAKIPIDKRTKCPGRNLDMCQFRRDLDVFGV